MVFRTCAYKLGRILEILKHIPAVSSFNLGPILLCSLGLLERLASVDTLILTWHRASEVVIPRPEEVAKSINFAYR